MKAAKQRINLAAWLLLTVACMSLWVQLMILYRMRHIDDPKEVHIMMPQMNSHALETACQ